MTVNSVVVVEGASAPSTQHVVLTFSDGAIREVDVPAGTTVLAAAKDSGISLVRQCEVGTCSSCVAQLCSGEAEMPAGQLTALTKAEIAAGQRLLCQTYTSTDASFDVEYPSSLLEANPPIFFEAKVGRLTWLAESVVQIDMKLPKSLKFGFTAGQYCRIRVPGTDEWRSYSMSSGEHEQFKLSFIIRVLPTGVMSDFLRTQIKTGMTLEMEGPLGGFVFEPADRHHVLIAGGTGLAPMLSMLDRLRLMRPTPPIDVVFGCVRESDLFHLDELAARRSFMPTLSVTVVLDEGGSIPDVAQGNPVTALDGISVSESSVAYLCGPPGMIRAATETLNKRGLALSDIRSEQFLPS